MPYVRGIRRRLFGLVALVVVAGCNRIPNAGTFHDAGPNPCGAQPAGQTCYGTQSVDCDGSGHATRQTDCAASGQVCAPGLGCRTCVPAQVRCDGETVRLCNIDGTALMPGPTCDPTIGEHCSPGGCVDLCAQAVTDHSYIGCDYYPTVLPNSELDPTFTYAVVISNPQLVSAQVTILHGTDVLEQLVVPAGGLALRELPWIEALRGDYAAPASVLVPDGAYHLVSDVPVTVQQFNPLRYQSSPDCTSMAPENGCFSYTNDASLVLPVHVLTGSYVVVSRPTHVVDRVDTTMAPSHSASPGFVAIVNAEDHGIMVTVRSSAYTRASADGVVPALSPGESHDFALAVGDVLLLETADPGPTCPGATDSDSTSSTMVTYCDPGRDYDLTGTEIVSAEQVAVYAGHDCAFVPYDRWACDHLEQQIFPVETLGNDFFVPVTHPLRMGEPNVLRVVAGGRDVHVVFDPPLDDGTDAIDLARGEHTEHEIHADVWVRADGPILGALFLVGQNYLGFDTIGRSPFAVGDPAMSMIVPAAQYRRSYQILAPDTYSQSWIGVAIPVGGQVYLDEAPITASLAESGSSGMLTGQLRIASGTHSVRGDHLFALYVYGFGSYTSYMVPGGMDFVPLGEPF